ncbi:hypothetical protein [Sabulicella glaciei]|uniref:Terminase small subunit n=1 Tax=Sabulicella glaciei TaxID=2984948 RepID=A0ABT3NUC9_9PROT|nr:hypothetical protein [Roseococcus sp. MDT2-1-1]MCW8085769.1 hypothetical protein [Roseococcus sp. MDT2-1-1]
MSAEEVPEIDALAAMRVLAREYDRLLHDEEADARGASARHAALKVMLAHYEALRKLLPRPAPSILDLGAARAAIAQEEPSLDDDEGESG